MRSNVTATALRRLLLLGALAPALALQGCATQPIAAQVSRESALQPGEGVVALRVVNLGPMQVTRIKVKADGGEQVYEMLGVHYGQTSTATFVGHLPAGRYQPFEMVAVGNFVQRSSPLAKLTGRFDVEAARVTDLGTLIHASPPIVDAPSTTARSWTSPFLLAVDPTRVPSEKLLRARFPALAAAVAGRSSLGWVRGTVPIPSDEAMQAIRSAADESSPPAMRGPGNVVTGGRLGVVVERGPSGPATRRHTGSVHQIESVLVLQDGRLLVGGEEGYVAISDPNGQRWKEVTGLAPDEVVIHLSQPSDQVLYMVTMHESGTTVYSAPVESLAWKPVRTLASARNLEHSFLAGARQRDVAVSTRERLVVHTMPDTVSTLDFRTGRWESSKTPRTFAYGMQATPDGYVLGKNAPAYVYGTLDYGKTWSRLGGWVISTNPVFTNRDRGLIISAGMGISPSYRLRRTADGGKTWSEGTPAGTPVADPLWLDADGKTLYTLGAGRFYTSNDDGRSWH